MSVDNTLAQIFGAIRSSNITRDNKTLITETINNLVDSLQFTQLQYNDLSGRYEALNISHLDLKDKYISLDEAFQDAYREQASPTAIQNKLLDKEAIIINLTETKEALIRQLRILED